LAEEHLSVAEVIAKRLRKRYNWVAWDELYSYSLWGLVLAAKTYRPEKGGGFVGFACYKGMYLAIDRMRQDGVVARAYNANRPKAVQWSQLEKEGGEMQDYIVDDRMDESRSRLETREAFEHLVMGLPDQSRQLLMMYYADGLTMREIAEVYEVSESAICIRHKALLESLRRTARRRLS